MNHDIPAVEALGSPCIHSRPSSRVSAGSPQHWWCWAVRGEHAAPRCHRASSDVSPRWVTIRSENEHLTVLSDCGLQLGPKGALYHRNIIYFIGIQQNTATMKWQNANVPHKEKYSSCVCYQQTAAGLLLGKVSGKCSSGKCFNKSLNST